MVRFFRTWCFYTLAAFSIVGFTAEMRSGGFFTHWVTPWGARFWLDPKLPDLGPGEHFTQLPAHGWVKNFDSLARWPTGPPQFADWGKKKFRPPPMPKPRPDRVIFWAPPIFHEILEKCTFENAQISILTYVVGTRSLGARLLVTFSLLAIKTVSASK